MRKSTVIILILAAVLLCGGCASTGVKNKTESAAVSQEENAPLAAPSDESANNTAEGIAGAVNEKAEQVKKAVTKAVDETVVAVKETAKDFGHEAKKFGKAAAGELNVNLSPLQNAAASAAKGVKANGSFPWWIIILIIIFLIIMIIIGSRKKKDQKPE
jgi:CHASE3 domain sensor protein